MPTSLMKQYDCDYGVNLSIRTFFCTNPMERTLISLVGSNIDGSGGGGNNDAQAFNRYCFQ